MDKLTLKNKERFFAQYWQLVVGMRSFGIQTRHVNRDFLDPIYLDESYLELKPLSSITDEDAIEVAKICFVDIDEDWYPMFVDDVRKEDIFPCGDRDVADYLRSKGYALPWLGITVEEMVEAGWIKLTSNDND